MNPYRCKISLRIQHPGANPADITSVLGVNPFRSWRAGEPRSTLKGTPLEGTWRDSYWTAPVAEGRWPQERLADAIAALLDQLAAHRDFLRQLRSNGGRVELFVGWFLEGQGGDVLGCALLGRMADLGIDLSLDVYPPDGG